MKVALDESLSWEKDSVNPDLMRVLPVNFSTEHKQMLAHLQMMINKEYLAIPKEHDKLIISLRTAYANEYSLTAMVEKQKISMLAPKSMIQYCK